MLEDRGNINELYKEEETIFDLMFYSLDKLKPKTKTKNQFFC